MTQEELDQLQSKALEQFKTGKSLFGKGGAFAPMLKQFIEAALEAEMEAHLDEEERLEGNKRNGKGRKTIKSHTGPVEIATPQDRQSTFEPQIIKKRETVLADSLQEKIIGLYGLGMSLRDISEHIKEMYDTEISHTLLSQITDRVIPEVKAWQNRPLEPVYCIVWLDAMHYKVQSEGKVEHKALYNVLGVNASGMKEVLGMYVSESEGANFWLQVLTDLQNRGLKDILIACTDNLRGFSEAIVSVYPKAEVQCCIVHQIRNSLKYVAGKDQKEFIRDLKRVYRADTRELAEMELEKLDGKWGSKYPIVIQSWQNNREKLTTYFQYTAPIRKLIYTTNAVEGYHRQIRKVTKTKGAFTSDMALLKLVYLATRNIEKKWTSPLANWGLTVQQLAIKFGGRLPLELEVSINRKSKEQIANSFLNTNDLQLFLNHYNELSNYDSEVSFDSTFLGESGELKIKVRIVPPKILKTSLLYAFIKLTIYIVITISLIALAIRNEAYALLLIGGFFVGIFAFTMIIEEIKKVTIYFNVLITYIIFVV